MMWYKIQRRGREGVKGKCMMSMYEPWEPTIKKLMEAEFGSG